MSSGCGDVLSLADLQTAKKHQIFEAEVITGKSGGVAGGTDIDYATNQVTGQTQKTLPAVLRGAGFRPASWDFSTGGTLTVNDVDLAVLWPGPSGDGQYYVWHGALPKVIPAASSPVSTGGVSSVAWVPFGDLFLRGNLAESDGLKLIGQCPDIATLRATEPEQTGQLIQVWQHTAGTNLGGGYFRAVLSASGYTDDNGVVIKTTGGAAWIRQNADEVTPFMFGAKSGGNDDTAAVQAAVDSGRATLLTSVFEISAPIILSKKSASIRGTGMHTSRIVQKPGTTGDCLRITDTCSLVELSNFGIYGTGAQQDTAFTAGTRGLVVPSPTGLSPDYPFNSSADPRRDLCINNIHIAGFDEYGLKIEPGNFSVTTTNLLVNHINQVGVYCGTTDWTWTNIQINTCGKECLVLDGCGNARIMGGKFIWADWATYASVGNFAGVRIENCQNLTLNGIEVQDCGSDGIHLKNSKSIAFSGLNTNRNSINSNYAFHNILFESSDATINGFVGLNYASNSGSGANSPAANFRFMTSDCSVTIDGVIETGYHGILFTGDNNIIQSTTSDVKINGIADYRRTGIQTTNIVPTFDGVSTTPVYVSVPSYVGQSNGLRLSQSNKDKIRYTYAPGPEGVTLAEVLVPSITGAETFNLMALGTGFGAGVNSLLLQLDVSAGGGQNVSLLLSGDGTTQVLSGTLPVDVKLQSGVAYHIALGAKPGYFWWSILNVTTGRRIRRSFRGPYLSQQFNSIFNLNSPVTFFSGSGAGDFGCSGVGAKIYVGAFSSESDYVASRYYNPTNPVDPVKMLSFRTLDSSI